MAGGGGGAGDFYGCSGGDAAAGVGRGQGPGGNGTCTGGGGGGDGTGSSGASIGDDTGGSGATQTMPGAGGMDTVSCASYSEPDGSAGSGPLGGNGYDSSGQHRAIGGGGGGSSDVCDKGYGTGGGAGSSYVTAGATNVICSNDTSLTPEVVISYTPVPGGYVSGGYVGTSFHNWTGTTSYAGFTCATIVLSYGGSSYENSTSTPIYPGDVAVPGSSSELDAPTSKTLQCSFQTGERPPTNLFTSGTSNACRARSGTYYEGYSWYQTENIAGLITIHCSFAVENDG